MLSSDVATGRLINGAEIFITSRCLQVRPFAPHFVSYTSIWAP